MLVPFWTVSELVCLDFWVHHRRFGRRMDRRVPSFAKSHDTFQNLHLSLPQSLSNGSVQAHTQVGQR